MYLWCLSVQVQCTVCSSKCCARFVHVFHADAGCVSVCVPVSIMVPGGRPASISRQKALVHYPSIDGPPVLDSRPLPTVAAQDG